MRTYHQKKRNSDFFLEMTFNTTIDFKGNKNIDIDIDGREHYHIIEQVAYIRMQKDSRNVFSILPGKA